MMLLMTSYDRQKIKPLEPINNISTNALQRQVEVILLSRGDNLSILYSSFIF